MIRKLILICTLAISLNSNAQDNKYYKNISNYTQIGTCNIFGYSHKLWIIFDGLENDTDPQYLANSFEDHQNRIELKSKIIDFDIQNKKIRFFTDSALPSPGPGFPIVFELMATLTWDQNNNAKLEDIDLKIRDIVGAGASDSEKNEMRDRIVDELDKKISCQMLR